MSRKGERRAVARKKHGKSKTERVNDQLLRYEKRLAEAEQRLSSWITSASSDIVHLRGMLAAAVEAMEQHDVTIAAMRFVAAREIPNFDEKVDARRAEIFKAKTEAEGRAAALAAEWNGQLDQMRADGMSEEAVRAIYVEAKRTMVAPEIVRMQHAQGKVSEVPEGAFEFRLAD